MSMDGYGSGIALSNNIQYSAAIEAFQKVLTLDPKNFGAWNRIGIAFNNNKQYSDAINAYRRAL